MKRYKITSIIAAVAFSFCACSEYVNPVQERGVAVVPTMSKPNPAVFDSNDLANTFVQFTVSLDDQDKSKVSEGAIQVSLNGNLERKEFSKISSFPSTVVIKLSDVASKLGIDLAKVKLGDVITIEVVTTTNGKQYRSNDVLNAAVVCGYNPALCSGSYSSAANDWGEGDITITVDPADEYTLYVSGLAAQEGLDEDAPLKIIVDPTTYELTASGVIAISTEEWGAASTYDNLTINGTGTLNTCDGTITLNTTISVDQGSFGPFAFTFTKK
jgi:hypothetical protein